MRERSKWPWLIGLAAATAGSAWLAQPWLNERGLGWRGVAEHLPASLSLPGDDADGPSALPGVVEQLQAMTPDEIRNRLFQEGSLVGTQPAGDWCINAQQQFLPCEGLRQRFEYYLLGLGEVGVADVRALIEDEARKAHGEAQTAQIMALFDRYWQIRTYDWKHHFIQSDRATWLPVFEEQRTVRRQILGGAWADAFFLEEEQHFQTYYAQLESGQAPPPQPGDPEPEMVLSKDPQPLRAPLNRTAAPASQAALP
jgi:hypothetical protein